MLYRSTVIIRIFAVLLILPALCFAQKKENIEEGGINLVVNRLLKTMQYGDEREREEAVIALGMIGDRKAVRPLCEYLKNTNDRNMRMVIIRALGRIRSPEATPVLIKVLETDDYEYSRLEAASALGEIADSDAIVALEVALKDRSTRVRRRCAQILKEITGEEYEYEGKVSAPPFDEYYRRLEELKAKTRPTPTPSG